MCSLYFTILLCLCFQVTCTISLYCMLCVQAFYPVSYVSELFTLFHHIFMYVYVSAFVYYFTVHINRARYVSILICYFTIQISMFMYPCVHSISPYCYVYVSKVLTLFHHTYVFMYPCFCSISPYILIIYVMYPNYSHYFTT